MKRNLLILSLLPFTLLGWANSSYETKAVANANPEVVRYALNRSMSPTMVAKYEEQLKVGSMLQRSLEEFVFFFE